MGMEMSRKLFGPAWVYGRAEEKKLTFLATYDVRGSSYGCIAATLSPCMPDT